MRVAGTFKPTNPMPMADVEVVTLSIYGSETDSVPLWQESQQVRVDGEGRYALLLGSTTAEGLPREVFASGEARWLGIHFERPGEVDQPRTRLTSVPYALRADDANTLGGLPASAFQLAGSTAARQEAGSSTSSDPVTALATAGTANFLSKFTSAVDLGNSVMFESAGRIGLGTTAPFDVFHSRFTDPSGALTGYAVQNLSGGAAAYSGMLFYDQNGALAQFQGFNNSTHEYRINNIASTGSINFMLGSASKFKVRSDGDVEISGALSRNGQRILQANTGGADNNLLLGSFGPILGNLTSVDNTALGTYALQNLTSGANNVAVGSGVLHANNANQNVVVGTYGFGAGTGAGNVGMGHAVAQAKVTGDLNIYIGYGVANDVNNTESNTIRIGDSGFNTRAFIGGIRGVSTGAANAVNVVIDSNGQLGTVSSSRRFKQDIQDMGEASSGLMKLRPVTYRYKQPYADGSKPIDYGLIAEEVEDVYPDLVAHTADGQVETVQYQKLNAMLLNEVQKQFHEIETLKARLATLERLIADQKK
jgi:hypothetical protein